MVRGEVGKVRFAILCALKNGNWTIFNDLRTYVEFISQRNFHSATLRELLVLMAGVPGKKHTPRDPSSQRGKPGEGWLEKKNGTEYSTIRTQWRIEPSVYPLLYFLLMSCPDENRCE